MTCGLLSSISSFLISLNKYQANRPVATSRIATSEMDEELVVLLKEHHLQHRRESLDIMGIITYHDLATTKSLSLKENHMFTGAELHHFDNLRDVCIKRYNEQKQQTEQPLLIKPVTKPIVTETGADRKIGEEPVYLGASLHPQPPANIDPLPPSLIPHLDTNVGQIPYIPTQQQQSYQSQPPSFHYSSGNYPVQYQSVTEQPIALPSMASGHMMSMAPPTIHPPYSVSSFRPQYSTMPPQTPHQTPSLYHNPNFYPQQNPSVYPFYDYTNPGPPKGDHMPTNPINNPHIDKFYDINESKDGRGFGLIFTNETFENHPDGKREGAKQDEINFEHIYNMMGLQVEKFYDEKTDDIIQNLTKISQRDFTEYQMLCVGFSTHGEQGDFLLGKDKKFSLYKEVISLFKPDKCPTLSGKPKIFLVQACRGCAINEVIGDSIVAPRPYTLESDFLIAHSVVSGYQAFRHIEKGSWFVSQLKNAFESYSKDFHFVDILTFANQLVVKLSNGTGKEGDFTQTCQFESTLTKILRIKPLRLV